MPTVNLLSCPNGGGPLQLHACERDGDDVVVGVLANLAAGTAYPIAHSIGLLLADEDTETSRHRSLLAEARPHCPPDFQRAIDATVARLECRPETGEGTWNREEMEYYDRAVATEELRGRMLEDIRTKPLWNIFLPRQRHLIRHIADNVRGKFVLEVGCGNARTVSWIFPPDKYDYRYVGFDISWDRLLVAKAALPTGDFMQASAMNPPFRRGMFHAILGFGVFHHLPSPAEGMRRCLDTVAPNGFIGLHEPIQTPKLLREGSRARRVAEKLLDSYDHSEHDNEIDLPGTLAMLRERHMSVVNMSYSHSPARALLNRVCGLFKSPTGSKRAYQVTIGVDSFLLRTACRVSARFGPRAVSVLARADRV